MGSGGGRVESMRLARKRALRKEGWFMAAQWYVAQVASGKEASTARLCEAFRGHPCVRGVLCPECEVMWKRGGQWELKRKLLFPGICSL